MIDLSRLSAQLSKKPQTLAELGASLDDIRALRARGENIIAKQTEQGRIYFLGEQPEAKTKHSFQVTERTNSLEIECVGDTIKTVEDAVKRAEIDLSCWEIVETTINSWEVAGKRKTGQDDGGRWRPEKLWKQLLWQVKVKLRRLVPKPIQAAIKDLLAEVKAAKLPRISRHAKGGHLVEIALFDAHFGKLCWGLETGENYDLKVAEADYVQAVSDLLDYVANFGIAKIVFPIGNDFFQVNNWLQTTAAGTRVDSVDDRFQKVFKVGCQAVRFAIEKCREVADVEGIWIPGNHDPETSWYMIEWLMAYFRDDPHIVFDDGPQYRKYRQFGKVLLAYTHGDEIRLDRLPLIMAAEQKELWSQTEYRAWRCGHFHKRAQLDYIAGDTYNGVKVDILPSISGTDQWHYRKGFVKNSRTAEAYLWHEDDGYVGHFSVGVRG